jgi:hypothetical protein
MTVRNLVNGRQDRVECGLDLAAFTQPLHDALRERRDKNPVITVDEDHRRTARRGRRHPQAVRGEAGRLTSNGRLEKPVSDIDTVVADSLKRLTWNGRLEKRT